MISMETKPRFELSGTGKDVVPNDCLRFIVLYSFLPYFPSIVLTLPEKSTLS